MDDGMLMDRGSTRGGFLWKLGKTVAVGLGVALAPAAATAFGGTLTNAKCCREDCMSCPQGEQAWRCWDCGGGGCCQCQSTNEPLGACRFYGCGVC